MKINRCDICGAEVGQNELKEVDKDYRVSDGAWVIDDFCIGCSRTFYDLRSDIERELDDEKRRRFKECLVEMAREAQAAPKETEKSQ